MRRARAAWALLALLAASVASVAVPRGVAPDKAHHYSGAGNVFTCLDGASAKILFSRVNDNYCDCQTDGSDEPGTAACTHGSFYCANRGYESQQLSASFVDDGICDCCDGSDEASGLCKNTCLEKSSTQKQAIRDRMAQISQSLGKKAELLTQATEMKSVWASKAHTIQSELEAQRAEVTRLEAAKAMADAAAAEECAKGAALATAPPAESAPAGPDTTGSTEETDEDRGRRIAAKWTSDPAAAGLAATASESAGEAAAARLEPQEQAGSGPASGHPLPAGAHPSLQQQQQQQQQGVKQVGGHEAGSGEPGPSAPSPWLLPLQPLLRQLTMVASEVSSTWQELCDSTVAYWVAEWKDFMRFVDVLAEAGQQLRQYWQDSVGTGGGIKEARRRQKERMLKGVRERDEKVKREMAGHLEALRAPWSVDNPPGWGQEDQVEAGQDSGAAGLAAAAGPGGVAAGQGVAGVADAQAVATEAGQALEAAQALLAELQQQARLVERYHLQAAAGGDFGPLDVFLPLAGRCLEDAGRWHYRACFFDSASQSEAGGLNKVSLGTWSGFSQDYQQAYFTGGDPCEGGPVRSLTLQLVCGAQEQLWGGEEPSPCTYTAWMSTPAACREQDREQEQARLQQLERVEEEVRAECGAAEGSVAHDEL